MPIIKIPFVSNIPPANVQTNAAMNRRFRRDVSGLKVLISILDSEFRFAVCKLFVIHCHWVI